MYNFQAKIMSCAIINLSVAAVVLRDTYLSRLESLTLSCAETSSGVSHFLRAVVLRSRMRVLPKCTRALCLREREHERERGTNALLASNSGRRIPN